MVDATKELIFSSATLFGNCVLVADIPDKYAPVDVNGAFHFRQSSQIRSNADAVNSFMFKLHLRVQQATQGVNNAISLNFSNNYVSTASVRTSIVVSQYNTFGAQFYPVTSTIIAPIQNFVNQTNQPTLLL